MFRVYPGGKSYSGVSVSMDKYLGAGNEKYTYTGEQGTHSGYYHNTTVYYMPFNGTIYTFFGGAIIINTQANRTNKYWYGGFNSIASGSDASEIFSVNKSLKQSFSLTHLPGGAMAEDKEFTTRYLVPTEDIDVSIDFNSKPIFEILSSVHHYGPGTWDNNQKRKITYEIGYGSSFETIMEYSLQIKDGEDVSHTFAKSEIKNNNVFSLKANKKYYIRLSIDDLKMENAGYPPMRVKNAFDLKIVVI